MTPPHSPANSSTVQSLPHENSFNTKGDIVSKYL